MHAPGFWGILIIAAVVLVLFGRGKISNMLGELGSGVKAFREGMTGGDEAAPASLRSEERPAATAGSGTDDKKA